MTNLGAYSFGRAAATYMRAITGQEPALDRTLADNGLDSLGLVELALHMELEFELPEMTLEAAGVVLTDTVREAAARLAQHIRNQGEKNMTEENLNTTEEAPKDYTFAKAAYTAYCEAVGGKAFNGDDLPGWDGIPQKIKDAWYAAVNAGLASYYEATDISDEDGALGSADFDEVLTSDNECESCCGDGQNCGEKTC